MSVQFSVVPSRSTCRASCLVVPPPQGTLHTHPEGPGHTDAGTGSLTQLGAELTLLQFCREQQQSSCG